MRRIVDRTLALIERTGSVDPSLREILAETGLSTQAFYRHFRSKDELLLVLLDDGRRQLVSYLGHRMAAVDDPREKVGAWVRGVLAQGMNEPAASRTRPFVASGGPTRAGLSGRPCGVGRPADRPVGDRHRRCRCGAGRRRCSGRHGGGLRVGLWKASPSPRARNETDQAGGRPSGLVLRQGHRRCGEWLTRRTSSRRRECKT